MAPPSVGHRTCHTREGRAPAGARPAWRSASLLQCGERGERRLEHPVADALVDGVAVLVVDEDVAAGDEAEALLADRVELEGLRHVPQRVVDLRQRERDLAGVLVL